MSESQDASWTDAAKILGAVIVIVFLISIVSGYVSHMKAYNGAQECEEVYGEGAEYVGEPSAFSSTGICQVGDEQQMVDIQSDDAPPIGPYLKSLV